MKYKMTIRYDGSRYKGWQSQKETDSTIQGKLMAVLEQMTGQPVDVQGSGRTDAGVHAMGQVASVELDCIHPDGSRWTAEEIKHYVNRYLPEDIGVMEVKEADSRFHARLNAEKKTYVYRIWNSSDPNVFDRKWMYAVEEPLDVEAMRQGAGYLTGTHDFGAFCAMKKKKKSTVRTVYTCEIEKHGNEVRFIITGNGFLHHMVRILVGTLTEIGLGKRKPEDIKQLLMDGDRIQAGITMPARGLILWQVEYPKETEDTNGNRDTIGKMDGNGQKGGF